MEARQAFLEAGGSEFHYIPCLNEDQAWIQALGRLAQRHMQGWDTRSTPDAQLLDRQRRDALALGATD